MSGTSGDGGIRWNDETQRWEAAGDAEDAGAVGPSTAPPPPIPAHVPTDPVGPTGAQAPYDDTYPVTPPPLPTPRSRRTTAVIAAATVVAVAGGVAGGVLALRDDGGGTSAASASDTTPPDSGPTDGVLPSDSSNAWSTNAPSPTDVPSGYVPQEDSSGFTIAVPEGWTREKKKGGIFYNSPDGGSLIQIFTITEPDTPYEALRQASRDLARSNRNYTQISLQDVLQDSGDPAAELVYAYDRPDGTRRQVVDRAFMTETGTQYAVLAAGPEEDWPQQRRTLEVALAHFAF